MPFKKGKSGNPGGAKAHRQKQLRELLMHCSPKAVEVIEKMLDDPEYALAAAKEVFDRVYGKPKQTNEIEVPEELLGVFLNGVRLGSKDK